MRRAESRRIRWREQRGAALILFATILILGVAWFAVGAFGRAARTTAETEIRTGQALLAAKKALLAYVALKAADSSESYPGRLPCPESLGQPGTSAEGTAAPVVTPSFPTCSAAGRLPWKTLGIDQPQDGYGEPLWYAVATGTWALVTSSTVLTINPGLGNQLTYDGVANTVVAAIIAPGEAINSTSASGTPPAGCSAVNQQSNRYAVPYLVTNFLECGNATGSYMITGTSPWSNDRTISITAAEVMAAIAGPVADRLQRQVAPAISGWNSLEPLVARQWATPYLPFASTFSDPATHSYVCGDAGVREGLLPLEFTSSCDTRWTGSVSLLSGLISMGCSQQASYLSCQFLNLLGIPPFSARITATGAGVANSFRSAIASSDLTITGGGSASTFSLALSDVTAAATATIDVAWPPALAIGLVEVQIPYLANAAVLTDSRLTWFKNNNWERYTYYSVAPSATANSSAPCAAAGDAGCIEIRGLPDSTGNYWNKRLALALVGPALSGQSRACTDILDASGAAAPDGIPDCQQLVNYLEDENKSTGDRIFRADFMVANLSVPVPPAPTPPFPPFNDRIAACPFQQTMQGGGTTSICN